MNTKTLIRLLIGLGGVGGALGNGYVINKHLSNENILKKLKVNKFEILRNAPETWKEILKSYSEVISDLKNKDLKFDNFDGKAPQQNAERVLEKKCKALLESAEVNEINYKKAIKWCTVPKTLTQILKDEKYTLLNTDNQKDEDSEAWNKKMEEHEKHTEVEEKIDNLNLLEKGAKKEKDERNKLRTKCKEFEDKKHYEKDFEISLEKAKLWCANK